MQISANIPPKKCEIVQKQAFFLGSFWDTFAVTFGLFWLRFGIILGSFFLVMYDICCLFWRYIVPFWDHLRTPQDGLPAQRAFLQLLGISLPQTVTTAAGPPLAYCAKTSPFSPIRYLFCFKKTVKIDVSTYESMQ